MVMYSVSCLLDAVDGQAARYYDQCKDRSSIAFRWIVPCPCVQFLQAGRNVFLFLTYDNLHCAHLVFVCGRAFYLFTLGSKFGAVLDMVTDR